jgi:hypothetical protein
LKKEKKSISCDNVIATLSLQEYNNLLLKKYYLYNKIPVYIKDPLKLEIHIDLEKIISLIENKIPEILVIDLKSIWIGDFPSLTKVNSQSLYKDNIIYLTNSFNTKESLYYSLLYEMNRATAEYYNLSITSDGQLEREFIFKRMALYNRLTKSQKDYISIEPFLDVKYNSELYKFLYTKLSESYLIKLHENIFIHYNGIYSLEEYFAITYYIYITKMNSTTKENLESYGPIVYNKLQSLLLYAQG